jgi:5'-methylthioadenosine phosphorylase
VIGMTNMPEARLAREAELPYASLCLVTDFDCWHHTEAAVEVRAVIQQLRRNAALAARIIHQLASQLPDPAESPASRALDAGLLTSPEQIGASARSRLGVLLSRRLGQGPT